MSEEWLTTFQAAAISGYHTNHVRRLVRAGKIRARKWGQAWQVSQTSLREYMQSAKDVGDKRGPKPT